MAIFEQGFSCCCGAVLIEGLYNDAYETVNPDLAPLIDKFRSKGSPKTGIRGLGVAITIDDEEGAKKVLTEKGAVMVADYWNPNSNRRNQVWLIPLHEKSDLRILADKTPEKAA